jgi:Fic family protein
MNQPVEYHTGGFPPNDLRWDALIPHIGPASAAVARYDGVLAAIPNPSVLLNPLMTREAVLSSRIEGTQATMGEVLEYEADASNQKVSEAHREDIREVLNYRQALRIAEKKLEEIPVSLRLIKEVHEVLLEGVRGQNRAPGEFRKTPNWIGPAGSDIEDARYIPIGADALPDALDDWERYIHADVPDQLVQLAVIHAEFEALHPFLDGNGRLGRILVPLFLWQRGLIRQPMFYMSGYLEANRQEYYDRLLKVSRDGDWTGWCRFFLAGIRDQAEENLVKAHQILELYEHLKPEVVDWTHSQYAIPALDWLFERPIFNSSEFISNTEIPDSTARRLLRSFKGEGLLREIREARGRRPAAYAFPRLLNIAEGHDIF